MDENNNQPNSIAGWLLGIYWDEVMHIMSVFGSMTEFLRKLLWACVIIVPLGCLIAYIVFSIKISENEKQQQLILNSIRPHRRSEQWAE